MKLEVRENLEESFGLSKVISPLSRQSRHCETSALGFYAGDTNLYRFVGDDPTNLLDPSGLQAEKQIETIRGKEVKLDKNTVKLKDSTGTVKVLIDATLKNRQGRQLEDYIQIQVTADKDLPADTHWLQFAQRATLGKDGKDIPTAFPLGRGERRNKKTWQETGKGFVDCLDLPDTNVPIYYDANPRVTRRGPRELTIFDSPDYDPKSMDSKQIWTMDTFLISEGKVYYHIQWKRVATLKDGKWIAEYTDIKGEPVNRLPDWARQDNLYGGYFPDEKDDPGRPIEYPNPIPKANR